MTVMRNSSILALALSALLVGCDVEAFLNQAASFGPEGGDAPAGAPVASGNRGSFQVIIENNTPYRAMFTVG